MTPRLSKRKSSIEQRVLRADRRSGGLLYVADIRDWKVYEPTVAAGHEAAVDVLSELDGPIGTLRKRPEHGLIADEAAREVGSDGPGQTGRTRSRVLLLAE